MYPYVHTYSWIHVHIYLYRLHQQEHFKDHLSSMKEFVDLIIFLMKTQSMERSVAIMSTNDMLVFTILE